MLTLNQIKKRIMGFLQSHAQVNEVFWGDDFELSAERDLRYPVAAVEFVNAAMSGKKLLYSLKFFLGDISDPNVQDIDDEIASDMILVAEDLLSWLEEQQGFEVQQNVNIQKTIDEFGDRVSGIVFVITLAVVRSKNDCAIPIKSNDPPVSP